MRMLTKLTLPLAALAGLQPVATQAQSAANAQLKTAIIFNIIRFVDFGEGGSTLSLCAARGVAGAQDLATLNGQRIRNRTIVHRSVDPASTGGCDVVYLGAASSTDIARARQHGTLLIGDSPSFINSGGTVGLVRTGSQIRFEVSTRAARASGITISSNLLRLAARVQQ